MKYIFSFGVAFLAFFKLSFGGVTLPELLSDHMVLKQNSLVSLWGKAPVSSIVEVTTSWNQEKYSAKADNNGDFVIKVSTTSAGGPFTISFSNNSETVTLTDVLLGEIWFCSGQSNMEMPMRGFKNTPVLNSKELIAGADNNSLRIFNPVRSVSFTKKESVPGKWQVSSPAVATKTSAVAWEFGKMLQEKLGVPVGIIVSAWGGTPIRSWMSKESLESFPYIDLSKPDTVTSKIPAGLFNGIVAPFTSFTVSGVLWYQGENDHKNAELYRKMMPAMVKDWRARFGNDNMPFYFVQIAPWKYEKTKIPYAALFREMQYQMSKSIPNSGIAVTTDIGSDKTIHPPDKTTVADRLLKIALAENYGKSIPYLGPELKNYKVRGNKMVLKFCHAKGLNLKNNNNSNFEIAGEDSVFHAAQGAIMKGKLIVWSPEVKKPTAVRYAFKNYVQGNLYNKNGLPASTFRTDNWHILNN